MIHSALPHGRWQSSCCFLSQAVPIVCGTSTGLYCAAWAGHENCVRKLIQFGAVLNVRKDGGFTPLFCAAENNRVVSGPLVPSLFLIELSGDSDMVRCHCQCVTAWKPSSGLRVCWRPAPFIAELPVLGFAFIAFPSVLPSRASLISRRRDSSTH
jgi:hypothetical protein